MQTTMHATRLGFAARTNSKRTAHPVVRPFSNATHAASKSNFRASNEATSITVSALSLSHRVYEFGADSLTERYDFRQNYRAPDGTFFLAVAHRKTAPHIKANVLNRFEHLLNKKFDVALYRHSLKLYHFRPAEKLLEHLVDLPISSPLFPEHIWPNLFMDCNGRISVTVPCSSVAEWKNNERSTCFAEYALDLKMGQLLENRKGCVAPDFHPRPYEDGGEASTTLGGSRGIVVTAKTAQTLRRRVINVAVAFEGTSQSTPFWQALTLPAPAGGKPKVIIGALNSEGKLDLHVVTHNGILSIQPALGTFAEIFLRVRQMSQLLGNRHPAYLR